MHERVLAWKANQDPAARLVLAVADAAGKRVGTLELMDRAMAAEPEVVRDITEWRAQNMACFLTQFQATSERTAAWLERVVLGSPERLLFMLRPDGGEICGHVGICRLDATSGEVDNVMRARRGGEPRLMFHAELALLSWMFGTLGLGESGLHVFSNNAPSVKLHEAVGYRVTRDIPISRRSTPELTEYLLDSDAGEPVDFSYFEMGLPRARFLDLHPWVRTVYPWTR